jgi:hypothetical protein
MQRGDRRGRGRNPQRRQLQLEMVLSCLLRDCRVLSAPTLLRREQDCRCLAGRRTLRPYAYLTPAGFRRSTLFQAKSTSLPQAPGKDTSGLDLGANALERSAVQGRDPGRSDSYLGCNDSWFCRDRIALSHRAPGTPASLTALLILLQALPSSPVQPLSTPKVPKQGSVLRLSGGILSLLGRILSLPGSACSKLSSACAKSSPACALSSPTGAL